MRDYNYKERLPCGSRASHLIREEHSRNQIEISDFTMEPTESGMDPPPPPPPPHPPTSARSASQSPHHPSFA